MAMSKRDRIGALILIGLMLILFVLLYFTANPPIGSGQYFDN
jgi:hypothetical protein